MLMHYDKRSYHEVLEMPTNIRREYLKFIIKENKRKNDQTSPNDATRMTPDELDELASQVASDPNFSQKS
jgi:hypothetical protein